MTLHNKYVYFISCYETIYDNISDIVIQGVPKKREKF